MIMNIAFSNLRGGCGSTTLILLMAHYLASLTKTVYLIDLTYERTLELWHRHSVLLEEKLPFEFFATELSNAPLLLQKFSRQDALLLLDLPKLSENEQFLKLIKQIDAFVIPFSYGAAGFNAAIRYAVMIAKMTPESSLIFLPNDWGEGQKGSNLEAHQRLLRKLGSLSAPLSFHIGLQGLESLSIATQVLFDFWATLRILSAQYLKVG